MASSPLEDHSLGSRIVTAMTLTPWTIRNYRVHGELVAVKSSFGYAFWQGNCRQSEGTDKVIRPSVERALDQADGLLDLRAINESLWDARHEAGYLDDIVLTSDDYRILRAVSEPRTIADSVPRAISDLRSEPVATYVSAFVASAISSCSTRQTRRHGAWSSGYRTSVSRS